MSENHKAIYPKSAKITEETIHVQRLDDIAKNIEIKEPFFVKIDVQGYEDKVIAGGKDTIKKASFIVAETAYLQLYEGQPLFNDIQNLLHSLGFSYYGAVERHYDKKGLPLYEDSAFIRSDLLSQPQ